MSMTSVDSDDEEAMLNADSDPNMEANRLLQAVVNRAKVSGAGSILLRLPITSYYFRVLLASPARG